MPAARTSCEKLSRVALGASRPVPVPGAGETAEGEDVASDSHPRGSMIGDRRQVPPPVSQPLTRLPCDSSNLMKAVADWGDTVLHGGPAEVRGRAPAVCRGRGAGLAKRACPAPRPLRRRAATSQTPVPRFDPLRRRTGRRCPPPVGSVVLTYSSDTGRTSTSPGCAPTTPTMPPPATVRGFASLRTLGNPPTGDPGNDSTPVRCEPRPVADRDPVDGRAHHDCRLAIRNLMSFYVTL